MNFKIGNIEINNPVVLAPMAGISNPAYMKIAENFGVGCAITELISAEAVVRKNKKTFDMLKGIENLKIPIGIQIFGSNPKTMAEAASILTNLYPVSFIDINMGCPVPKVALRSNAGSGLLKDPNKVYEIVREVVKSVNVPVTVKIRSGWDFDSINALEVAKKIEEAKASAITIHPRTRSQGYSGVSDWNIIKEIKENVNISVIGNGDIKNCYDAKKMIDETGCDAIMIGRALIGNPWLIKDCVNYLNKGIEPKEITVTEKLEMIKGHVKLLEETKDEHLALLEIRNHIAYYLKGINNSSKLKQKIFRVKTINELINLLDNFTKDYMEESL